MFGVDDRCVVDKKCKVDYACDTPNRQVHFYLTESVYKVVLQSQLRQLILDHYQIKDKLTDLFGN